VKGNYTSRDAKPFHLREGVVPRRRVIDSIDQANVDRELEDAARRHRHHLEMRWVVEADQGTDVREHAEIGCDDCELARHTIRSGLYSTADILEIESLQLDQHAVKSGNHLQRRIHINHSHPAKRLHVAQSMALPNALEDASAGKRRLIV
jgi:hypothetical protein